MNIVDLNFTSKSEILTALSNSRVVNSYRYGEAERCVADIYFPPQESENEQNKSRAKNQHNTSEPRVTNQDSSKAGLPIAIFCHGGIWTVGATSLW